MITKILKKTMFAFLIIYGLDLILGSFNIIVPINYYTVAIVTALGFPGFVTLALSFFFLL